jgi:hypothetical protein
MGLGKNLEDVLAVMTFAEVGEFDTARQMVDGSRRVLLALRDDQLPTGPLRCAANLCRRTNAGLDLLRIPGARPLPDEVQESLDQLRREGVPWRVLRAAGELGRAVLQHVATQRSVHLVVIDSLEGWQSARGHSWQQLDCPLVVAGVGNTDCKSM